MSAVFSTTSSSSTTTSRRQRRRRRRRCPTAAAIVVVATASFLPGIYGQGAGATQTLPIDSWATEPEDVAVNLQDMVPLMTSPNKNDYVCDVPAQSGVMSGICIPAHEARVHMSFCKEKITYPVCAPPTQPYWPNWDIRQKDTLIQELFKIVVDERIRRESNLTTETYLPRRYLQNAPCIDALKNVMCWQNFPRCKSGTNASFPLCRVSCVNYYENCLYSSGEAELLCSNQNIESHGLFDAWLDYPIGSAERKIPATDKLLDFPDCTGLASSKAFGVLAGVLLLIRAV